LFFVKKSALHIAAEFGDVELVRFFVDLGLPVDARDATVCYWDMEFP
jgi:ankyrin repeat protein